MDDNFLPAILTHYRLVYYFAIKTFPSFNPLKYLPDAVEKIAIPESPFVPE